MSTRSMGLAASTSSSTPTGVISASFNSSSSCSQSNNQDVTTVRTPYVRLGSTVLRHWDQHLGEMLQKGDIISCLQDLECIEYIDFGTDPNRLEKTIRHEPEGGRVMNNVQNRDANLNTYFHCACQRYVSDNQEKKIKHGPLQIMKRLHRLATDKNALHFENAYGQTCLQYACKEGQAEIVHWLVVTQGVRVNQVDKAFGGLTPLHWSIWDQQHLPNQSQQQKIKNSQNYYGYTGGSGYGSSNTVSYYNTGYHNNGNLSINDQYSPSNSKEQNINGLGNGYYLSQMSPNRRYTSNIVTGMVSEVTSMQQLNSESPSPEKDRNNNAGNNAGPTTLNFPNTHSSHNFTLTTQSIKPNPIEAKLAYQALKLKPPLGPLNSVIGLDSSTGNESNVQSLVSQNSSSVSITSVNSNQISCHPLAYHNLIEKNGIKLISDPFSRRENLPPVLNRWVDLSQGCQGIGCGLIAQVGARNLSGQPKDFPARLAFRKRQVVKILFAVGATFLKKWKPATKFREDNLHPKSLEHWDFYHTYAEYAAKFNYFLKTGDERMYCLVARLLADHIEGFVKCGRELGYEFGQNYHIQNSGPSGSPGTMLHASSSEKLKKLGSFAPDSAKRAYEHLSTGGACIRSRRQILKKDETKKDETITGFEFNSKDEPGYWDFSNQKWDITQREYRGLAQFRANEVTSANSTTTIGSGGSNLNDNNNSKSNNNNSNKNNASGGQSVKNNKKTNSNSVYNATIKGKEKDTDLSESATDNNVIDNIKPGTTYTCFYSQEKDAQRLTELEEEFISDHRDLILQKYSFLNDVPQPVVCKTVGMAVDATKRSQTIKRLCTDRAKGSRTLKVVAFDPSDVEKKNKQGHEKDSSNKIVGFVFVKCVIPKEGSRKSRPTGHYDTHGGSGYAVNTSSGNYNNRSSNNMDRNSSFSNLSLSLSNGAGSSNIHNTSFGSGGPPSDISDGPPHDKSGVLRPLPSPLDSDVMTPREHNKRNLHGRNDYNSNQNNGGNMNLNSDDHGNNNNDVESVFGGPISNQQIKMNQQQHKSKVLQKIYENYMHRRPIFDASDFEWSESDDDGDDDGDNNNHRNNHNNRHNVNLDDSDEEDDEEDDDDDDEEDVTSNRRGGHGRNNNKKNNNTGRGRGRGLRSNQDRSDDRTDTPSRHVVGRKKNGNNQPSTRERSRDRNQNNWSGDRGRSNDKHNRGSSKSLLDHPDCPRLEISHLKVQNSEGKKGIGKLLIIAALEHVNRSYDDQPWLRRALICNWGLSVFSNNERAKQFYMKIGMKEDISERHDSQLRDTNGNFFTLEKIDQVLHLVPDHVTSKSAREKKARDILKEHQDKIDHTQLSIGWTKFSRQIRDPLEDVHIQRALFEDIQTRNNTIAMNIGGGTSGSSGTSKKGNNSNQNQNANPLENLREKSRSLFYEEMELLANKPDPNFRTIQNRRFQDDLAHGRSTALVNFRCAMQRRDHINICANHDPLVECIIDTLRVNLLHNGGCGFWYENQQAYVGRGYGNRLLISPNQWVQPCLLSNSNFQQQLMDKSIVEVSSNPESVVSTTTGSNSTTQQQSQKRTASGSNSNSNTNPGPGTQTGNNSTGNLSSYSQWPIFGSNMSYPTPSASDGSENESNNNMASSGRKNKKNPSSTSDLYNSSDYGYNNQYNSTNPSQQLSLYNNNNNSSSSSTNNTNNININLNSNEPYYCLTIEDNKQSYDPNDNLWCPNAASNPFDVGFIHDSLPSVKKYRVTNRRDIYSMQGFMREGWKPEECEVWKQLIQLDWQKEGLGGEYAQKVIYNAFGGSGGGNLSLGKIVNVRGGGGRAGGPTLSAQTSQEDSVVDGGGPSSKRTKVR